ncbi:MAG: hypothetical protein QOJ42_3750, partial [Acidobacteriaceae bacterium]|nr:hypothetical protein [Acidobacteriaceae bacterium]
MVSQFAHGPSDLASLSAEGYAAAADIRRSLSYIEVPLELPLLDKVTLVDTPGLNSPNEAHTPSAITKRCAKSHPRRRRAGAAVAVGSGRCLVRIQGSKVRFADRPEVISSMAKASNPMRRISYGI